MNLALQAYIDLLEQLISIPSFSREEAATASILADFLTKAGIRVQRHKNNVWAQNRYWNPHLPVLLLNSHHDTVKPVSSWTRDPFLPQIEGDRLYGLGSNDAGGPLVSLIACFLHFNTQKNLPYNLILAATAEEEISGQQGIGAILDQIGPIDLAIVGEPTLMQLAIAEKGLMVLDCRAQGIAGHAARQEGKNAIYSAMKDIQWFQSHHFEKVSDFLGPVKMTVTQVQAGTQHNVVPDQCNFVVDVRSNEHYSNEALFKLIDQHTEADIKARSFRLNASGISPKHPIVLRGQALGRKIYGSPTLSDQALMPFPSLKIGPGDSARSHSADEFICLSEIESGMGLYIKLLEGLQVK